VLARFDSPVVFARDSEVYSPAVANGVVYVGLDDVPEVSDGRISDATQ